MSGTGGFGTEIAEWKFFDGGGTQIATTGGTASASGVGFGLGPANAFDGSSSTFWDSGDQATAAIPDWLQYQFTSAVTVASFSIQARNDATYYAQAPASWALQGSSDGSTWTTIGKYSAKWASANQTQTFDVGSFALGKAYRLLITADSAGQNTSIAEWKLFDGGGTQISTPVGVSGASSSGGAANASTQGFNGGNFPAPAAFDGSASTFWTSQTAGGSPPSSGSPEWLEYRFSSSSPSALGSFSITARNDGSYNQAPSAFSLQSSPDDVTWTTVGTYTATWTGAGQTQTFTVSGGGGGGLLMNPGMDGGMRPQMKGGMNG